MLIDVEKFLSELGVPVLDHQDGELWYRCHHCGEPTAHIRQGDRQKWLVFYCESCTEGGNGVELWAAVRSVLPERATLDIKTRLLGHVPKQSPEQKWRKKEERVVELYSEQRGMSTRQFVTKVVTAELGISERSAWRLWGRAAVRNGITRLLEDRVSVGSGANSLSSRDLNS